MDVVKRLPLSLLAAVLLTLLGVAGLVRGAVPLESASAAGTEHGGHGGGQPLVVSGVYVREPANGVKAAAYFTIYNTSDTPDVLRTVQSGAGADTSLHTDDMQDTSSLSIPAHGSASLSPGKGHVMISKLYGPLKAGQSVNLQLTFDKSGQLLVTAPVIGVTAPAPTVSAPR